jgi:hypothetical protein
MSLCAYSLCILLCVGNVLVKGVIKTVYFFIPVEAVEALRVARG